MTKAIKSAAAKSWKTTACGALTFLTVLFHSAAIPMLDGVAATEPSWGLVMAAFGVMLTALNSRDHGVSSEQAGAKTQPTEVVK